MITSLYSGSSSEYITVTTPTLNGYSMSSSPGVGMVRWNSAISKLEVNDGVSWREISTGTAYVDITSKTREILVWAEGKMREDKQLEEMCKKYPALDQAKKNLDIIRNLVKDEYENQVRG